MSKIDLNIVDRGVQGTNWIAEDVGLTAEHLDDVMEQKTDNSGALNSLPTPFARFFVAKEAFRRAKEEHLNSKKEAGFAYRQLVSDILDVYELLFNIKYHRNNSWRNGEKLEIREWIASENLDYIKKKMPVLYNSVEEYYQTDINEKKLYFLVFTEDGKDKLLACSSLQVLLHLPTWTRHRFEKMVHIVLFFLTKHPTMKVSTNISILEGSLEANTSEK